MALISDRYSFNPKNYPFKVLKYLIHIITRMVMFHRLTSSLQIRDKSLPSSLLEHTATRSALSRCPDDVLYEIFSYFVGGTFRERVNHDDMKWRVSQVSYQWRKVAESMTLLWSTIAIDLDETVDMKSPNLPLARYRLDLQLQRSACSPLRIMLSSKRVFHDDHPLFLILLPSAMRWSELRFYGSTDDRSFSSLSGLLPNLRLLEFVPAVLSHGYPAAFNNAPRLRDVIIPTDRLSDIPIPIDQITSFGSFGNIINIKSPVRATIDAVQHLPNVEHLHINLKSTLRSPSEDSFPAVQQEQVSIKELYLHTGPGDSAIAEFLDAFSMPSLQRFGILHPLSTTDLQAAVSFIQRSHAEITDVRLHCGAAEDVFYLLQHLPFVTRLSLRWFDEAERAVFLQMFASANPASFIPRLSKLSLLGLEKRSPVMGINRPWVLVDMA